MYRKDSTGWIKHVDFIILDLICLQVAFVLAYALSGYGANPYQLILYRNMAVFMEVADLVVLFAMGTLKNVLKRGYYKDFVVTAQHGVILGACLLLYLFMLQEGQQYSRLALVLNNRYIADDEVGKFFSKDNLVVVMPYLDATQSGVSLTAMEFGAVIIASDTGGLKEQLDDGKIGLYCEPGNVDSLVEQMEKVITDSEIFTIENEKMKRYLDSLEWDKVTKKMLDEI